MNNRITLQQCVAALEANGLRYARLGLQNGVQVLITEYGGRVLGPFLAEDGESLFWSSKALAHPAALGAVVAAREWNVGGDRLWIAPEIQYNARDRTDFWGSLALPPQMDPGHYALEQVSSAAWRLYQEVTLEAYNLAQGSKTLQVERMIRPADDPLRSLAGYAELVAGVTYAGYEQGVTLTDMHPDAILSEAWNLTQVNPGGRLWIPAAGPVEVTDYYAPVDAAHLQRHSRGVALAISGQRQYKVGLQAATLFGRAAYANHTSDGIAYAVVRAFFNNPSAPYVEEPAHLVGRRGHSVHVYNDDGGLGGFGEMECNGQAIGGSLGRSTGTDQFLTWVYAGPQAQIDAVLEHLVGKVA